MKKINIPKLIFATLVVVVLFLSFNFIVHAQNVDSANYTLIQPTTDSVNGISDSTNYSVLIDSSPISDYTISSSNYDLKGGTAAAIEAFVPEITCLESSTTGGTTACTGIPGTDGMQGVCSEPGCYDRVKLEIDANSNPLDARYAIQVSTVSDFSSNVSYVTGATRLLKNTLAITDFLYKCEWEGTISVGYCAAANTTWQRYNIIGLVPGTTYYMRVAALKGSDTNGSFTQSPWGPSQSVLLQNTTISIDVDIAPSTAGSSSPPYILTMQNVTPNAISTSNDYIIFRLTSNALSGTDLLIKGQNGALQNGSNQILNVNADLASNNGYGLRNDSTTNSSQNAGTIGTIAVSSTPSDFTDTGATDKVGSPTTAFVKLFSSNSQPLDNGVSGYKVKVKPSSSTPPGLYTEILTCIPVGRY